MSVVERPTVVPLSPPAMESPRLGVVPATKPRKKRKRPIMLALVLAAMLGGAGYGGYVWFAGAAVQGDGAVVTHAAAVESFDVRIPLTGELRAIKNVEIRSQVESTTPIIWIVPEGTQVKAGDLLVRLASDQIKDRLEDYKIRVENDRAAVINAEQLLAIQKNQCESDLAAAEITADLAKKDWEQFSDVKNGDAKIELDTRQTTAVNAKSDRDRKQADLDRARSLFQQKYVSSNDVLDAEIALRDAQNKLQTAEANLVLWRLYVQPKQETTLKQKMKQTDAEVVRTKAKNTANLASREADLRAKQQTLRWDEDKLEATQKQLAACEIRAPQPGMVVYQSSVNNSPWSNQGPIEEGTTVRLNQTIIQLPDTSRMQVEVRLAEQMIERVKAGQDAVITIDALPGRVFSGHVATIATLPDSGARWNNQNTKEYITTIPLNEAIDQGKMQVKPGMTTKVEILIREVKDVIAVPVQAVFSGGGKSFVYVGTAANWKKREVELGALSQTKVEVKKGLAEGETVLLSKPKNANDDTEQGIGKGRGRSGRGGRGAAKESDTPTTAPAGSTTSPATAPATAPAGRRGKRSTTAPAGSPVSSETP